MGDRPASAWPTRSIGLTVVELSSYLQSSPIQLAGRVRVAAFIRSACSGSKLPFCPTKKVLGDVLHTDGPGWRMVSLGPTRRVCSSEVSGNPAGRPRRRPSPDGYWRRRCPAPPVPGSRSAISGDCRQRRRHPSATRAATLQASAFGSDAAGLPRANMAGTGAGLTRVHTDTAAASHRDSSRAAGAIQRPEGLGWGDVLPCGDAVLGCGGGLGAGFRHGRDPTRVGWNQQTTAGKTPARRLAKGLTGLTSRCPRFAGGSGWQCAAGVLAAALFLRGHGGGGATVPSQLRPGICARTPTPPNASLLGEHPDHQRCAVCGQQDRSVPVVRAEPATAQGAACRWAETRLQR